MDDSTESTDRMRDVLAVVTQLYEDARARTEVIRGIALAAMGVLSVLAALTDLESVAELGAWAVPALALVGTGLVSSLAVLLKARVMVPYDSKSLAGVARGFTHDMTSDMLTAVTEAEMYTRKYNNRAAWLVNFTLTTFVAAVMILVFQVSLGPVAGMVVGGTSAAVVIAAAFVVRKFAFAVPAKKGTDNE